nr:cyclic nucleotide-binding domain-containing protein 1 isoform X1 [Misgurnus anguillicaudatus]XP_055038301.1 cyclic nucleotide-binding domain-containing protein 1 isoform X1 [Misgurnus anguillicaudatus]XP_055038303.1 cyclic nucleotide-binding domain-containing protein 1 isoform X1 [Misgurnus anguillicaudatus]XP_055038304.1 cyclic nucleotide-binding domain-containing protein 1 isoform X1 [Misgurnus anguillicaudatus]XP_055038305.1 cyclic nucleotide-binding domain-containing protein 1 isoform X1
MNSYKRVLLRPQTSLPRIHLKSSIRTSMKLRFSESSHEFRRQPDGKLTQESLISHVIKALKKLPIERCQYEHHVIYKLLKGIHSVTSQLGSQELKQISTISTIETWDRGQVVFGHNGFYIVLMGSVKPYNRETLKEEQKLPTIAAGGSFGSFGPVNSADGDAIIQCVLTLETCEILKISRFGYEKLKKDILAQDHSVKLTMIQSCQLYLHWPKPSISHLANVTQLKTFPANQVLVKEGKVCPFVVFIGYGECNVLQDVGSFVKPMDKKGCKIKFVVVGKLGPKQSFGEVSILMDQPSPFTIITATEVHGGIIQAESLKELDAVTTSLILQTAQPISGKLSKEEVTKEFLTQEKMKKWELEKRKILSDAVFYNGVRPGNGKWTYNRGPRAVTGKIKTYT